MLFQGGNYVRCILVLYLWVIKLMCVIILKTKTHQNSIFSCGTQRKEMVWLAVVIEVIEWRTGN